ncbi:MAG TPA: hypothetical protein VHO70_24110 [Chitinispirillaceae bacterium]|nr:hypothetical protein [Chitinispirillaceae bacterium]
MTGPLLLIRIATLYLFHGTSAMVYTIQSIESHVYMNSGLYNAILTVTDEYGNADSHSIEIIVDYKTSIHTVRSTVPT